MKSTMTLAAAALGFFTTANAHMILHSPVPFGLSTLNNSPLDNSGSDFPCKQRTGVYDITQMNNIEVGVPQELSFNGSAVHGGGSCQVSVTLDQKPTKDSQWKVIHSIIGGCPANVAGNLGDGTNDASTFKFTLPKGVPNGQYTLAWTWFNKIGNREIYMNCAPITVSGGGSDNSVLEKLPDMFVANLPRESCEVPDSSNLVFPNPGDSVETAQSSALATAVSGSGCASVTKLGAGKGTLGSAGNAASTGGASSAAASQPAATSAAQTSGAAGASNTGGVFAPGASSAAAAAPTSFTTLLVTQTAGVAASSAPVGGTGVGTAPASSSTGVACSSNGAVVCIGTSQFGICDNGVAVPQALAAGTTCANGAISKRSVRRVPLKARRAAAERL